jgi:hypothetical protein
MEKPLTISDLKDLESNKKDLTPQQHLAVKNFDRYRFKSLSGIKNEDRFHQEYQRLQSMANLTSFEEFLKEKYL